MKLTPEQLAELIAKVFASISEKRKAASKEADPAPADDSIGTDEILSAVSEILGDLGEPADPGAKADDTADTQTGEAEISPELIARVVEALGSLGAKAAAEPSQQKAAEPAGGSESKAAAPAAASAPAPQRKYASLFLSGVANPNPGATGFKARIASMSAPERTKTVYGMFGRAVKCLHAAGGNFDNAAFIAERKFMDAEMAREFKALSATVPSDGGYLVPEVYASEIIELLYPATVIFSLGARRLGMSNGNMNIPKVRSGSRAKFVGENRKIPSTAPGFGNLKLSARKLTAIIPMSNDLLRSTNFDNDVIVGQDITKQMALGADYGALMGKGGEFQPVGITENKNVLTIDTTKLDADYASSAGVLTAMFPGYMVAAVLKNNVLAGSLGFTFNTSVEQYFKNLRDSVGGFIFAEEMNKQHTLVGYPYRTTNLFETVGGKTKIIFGDWNDLVIGEQGALEIETSREGSWTDEAGNLISAFENDQTIIRAINNVDAGLRHDESFAVADKVAVPI